MDWVLVILVAIFLMLLGGLAAFIAVMTPVFLLSVLRALWMARRG